MNARESICSIVSLISLLGGAPLVGADSVRITPEGEHVVPSVHQPSITAYLPPQGTMTGAAVIIAPGGGHRELWMDHDRLAREKESSYTIEGSSLADIERAIRVVRRHASEWGVKPDRIGVMGFSAGGEIAALAATRYHTGSEEAADEIDRQKR